MPSESELLVRGPRSDEVEPLPYDAGPETEALRLQAELTEQHRTSLDSANSATQAPAEDAGPLSRELSSVSLTSNASATVVTVQPSDTGPSNTTPRRPRIWQLPFCAGAHQAVGLMGMRLRQLRGGLQASGSWGVKGVLWNGYPGSRCCLSLHLPTSTEANHTAHTLLPRRITPSRLSFPPPHTPCNPALLEFGPAPPAAPQRTPLGCT